MQNWYYFLFLSLFFSGHRIIASEQNEKKSNNLYAEQKHHEYQSFQSVLSEDRVTAFRVRGDFDAELDEDTGWAAPVNSSVTMEVDRPFRLRFEVETDTSQNRRQYSLQYRINEADWHYVEAHHFPYPSAQSPSVSIVGCDAFFLGEEADDLLSVSKLPSGAGAGITLSPVTPGWYPDDENMSAEWEFALVIRRWADGPDLVENGDKISLRMVDQMGNPLKGLHPEITMIVPDGHLGGTFVETPARIGPYENSDGHLYFIMEPTETDNIFMMVKSTDGGKSWFEVDPENRPEIADLEGVGSVISNDGVIHIVHQISEAVYHHAFATSDHPDTKDRWIVDSELITSHAEPSTQVADIVLRPDGSMVVAFAAGSDIQYSIYSPGGKWSAPKTVNQKDPVGFTNPSLVALPDGTIEIAYKDMKGKGWNRQLLPDNILTEPQFFAQNLGTAESVNIPILPLVYMPQTETVVVVFRQSDGYLYLCHKSGNNSFSKPMRITDQRVVTNAVDSDQTGADVVVFDNQLVITYISEDDRSIHLSRITDLNIAPESEPIIQGIDGSWVRGNILYHQLDAPIYGIIYDAGSKGGSGFNKYFQLESGIKK